MGVATTAGPARLAEAAELAFPKEILRDHPLQASWPFWLAPPSGLRGLPRPRLGSACLCPPTIIYSPGPAPSRWPAHEPSHHLHSAWTMQHLPEPAKWARPPVAAPFRMRR